MSKYVSHGTLKLPVVEAHDEGAWAYATLLGGASIDTAVTVCFDSMGMFTTAFDDTVDVAEHSPRYCMDVARDETCSYCAMKVLPQGVYKVGSVV